jgi:uncharacterized SAM-binding protein YcdF (DUF218 family)
MAEFISGLKELPSPITWPLWLWLLSLLLSRPLWAGMLRRIAMVWLLIVSVTPLGFWLLSPLEHAYSQPQFTKAPDGIILLTGAESLHQAARSGQLELSAAAERLTATAALMHRFPDAKLIIAGGVALPGQPHDSTQLRDYLASVGIAPERMSVITASLNTWENAREVAALPRSRGQWLLVTSAFHMPRAMVCFEQFGMKPVPFPVDHRLPLRQKMSDYLRISVMGNLSAYELALHEWGGLIAYRLMGRTDRIWPSTLQSPQ